MRGIQYKIIIYYNKEAYDANSGLKTTDLAAAGVSTLIRPLLPNESNSFSFDLNLNGSEQVSLIPVGESNAVKINSSWPSHIRFERFTVAITSAYLDDACLTDNNIRIKTLNQCSEISTSKVGYFLQRHNGNSLSRH